MHEVVCSASATRREDGSFALAWDSGVLADPVAIRVGHEPLHLDELEPVFEVAGGKATLEALSSERRLYFELRDSKGVSVVCAERAVRLDGAVNFRDLGGYLTTNGRRIGWGRLFRSGHLANLSPSGMAQLESLGLDMVCDFRTAQERAQENAELPAGIQFRSLEIPPGVADARYLHRVFATASGPEAVVAAVHEIVLSMVQQSAPRYGALFEALLAPGTRNVLINCSAGKERTGVGAALLLSALGVPRETIYYDFMLSRDYFPAEAEIPRVLAKYEIQRSDIAATDLVMPLLETRKSYLAVALDYIDREFGNVTTFLAKQYNLQAEDLSELQARYTTK